MAFPFTFTFKRTLRGEITPENKEATLAYIKNQIEQDGANKVNIDANGVSYKGSTKGRHSLFAGPDGGRFSLEKIDDKWYLIYTIQMYYLYIFVGSFSVILWLATHQWLTIFLPILWLGGMNSLIIFVRHGELASRMSFGINDLLFGKNDETQKEERDVMNGKLKSWF